MKTFKLNILLLLTVFVLVSCKKKEESSLVNLDGDWSVYKVETTELKDSIPDYLLKTDQEWITYYSALIYIENGFLGGLMEVYFFDGNVVYKEDTTQIAKKITDTEIMIEVEEINENRDIVLNQEIYLKKK